MKGLQAQDSKDCPDKLMEEGALGLIRVNGKTPAERRGEARRTAIVRARPSVHSAKARWPLSAPNPTFAGSPLQHDRLKAHDGFKTAKHQNQQKDFYRFACHIDTRE